MKELSLKERVENALAEVRPYLNEDNGDIELVGIKDFNVFVAFKGNCEKCFINKTTLRGSIEATIKRHAPEVLNVIDIKTIVGEK